MTGFVQALKKAREKGFDLGGRTGRAECWQVFLALTLPSLLLLCAVYWQAQASVGEGYAVERVVLAGVFVWLFVSVLLFPVFVRRLHDSGRSGWWFLLYPAVPGIGVIWPSLPEYTAPVLGLVLFSLLVQPGTRGPNHYGQDPRAIPERMAAPAPESPQKTEVQPEELEFPQAQQKALQKDACSEQEQQ